MMASRARQRRRSGRRRLPSRQSGDPQDRDTGPLGSPQHDEPDDRQHDARSEGRDECRDQAEEDHLDGGDDAGQPGEQSDPGSDVRAVATGRAQTVSFWASEEALRASDEAAKQTSQERSATWNMEVVGMVGYEVVLDERVPSDDSGNRVARVTRMEGAPARVDGAVTYTREKVLPLARELEGNRGILSLVARATGKG